MCTFDIFSLGQMKKAASLVSIKLPAVQLNFLDYKAVMPRGSQVSMLLPRVEEVELILNTKQNEMFNPVYTGYWLQFRLSRISCHDIRDNNI